MDANNEIAEKIILAMVDGELELSAFDTQLVYAIRNHADECRRGYFSAIGSLEKLAKALLGPVSRDDAFDILYYVCGISSDEAEEITDAM